MGPWNSQFAPEKMTFCPPHPFSPFIIPSLSQTNPPHNPWTNSLIIAAQHMAVLFQINVSYTHFKKNMSQFSGPPWHNVATSARDVCSLHSPSIAFQLGQFWGILALWTFRFLNLFAFCDFLGGRRGGNVLLIISIFNTLVMNKYVCKYTVCINNVQIILNVSKCVHNRFWILILCVRVSNNKHAKLKLQRIQSN